MKRFYIILLLTILNFANVFAQDRSISGIVRDSDGKAIDAVTIRAIPSNKVVGRTNSGGAFSVKIATNITSLRLEHASYNSSTIQITDKNVYNISLDEKTTEIETVTVGYVARKKESLTGSAVVISAKDIKDSPAASFTDLLQGRVPGMNVQLNTGTPGVRGSMSIRGLNSANVSMSGSDAFLTPTSPLFVVDGVPIDENSNFEYGFQTQGPGISPVSMIPVEDIENITVLKDAQATALYGSKGAYGVILVTTKRGNSKIPIVSYQSKYFVNTIPSLRSVIGGLKERRLRINQILMNDTTYAAALQLINSSPMLADSLNAYYNNSTNWQSYFYAQTFNNQQQVNIMGGDQSFNYKIAPAYYNENGIVKNTGFTRYTLNTNMQYRPSERFLISSFLNTYMVRNSFGSGNAYQQSGVAEGANTSSLLPAPSLYSGSFESLASTNVLNDNKTGYAKAQMQLEYEIFKGFKATTNFDYTYDIANQDQFTPEILNSGQSKIYTYSSRKNVVYNRNMLQFNKVFGANEQHNVLAYVFSEVDVSDFRAEAMRLIGTGNDAIQSALSYNTRDTKGGYLDNLKEFRGVGYAGNLTYQFSGKYIVEGMFRLDGNSNRGSSSLWSKSPSFGVRWNAHQESFMEGITWLNAANVRLSWGRNITPTGTIYDAYGKYSMQKETYNGQPVVSIDNVTVPNNNMEPIINTQWNFGLDFALLNNSLSFTYETYYKQIDKDLVDFKLSNITGFSKVKLNEQSVVNMGHELSMFYRPTFSNSDWTVTTYLNGAFNRDYMASLVGGVRQVLQQHEDPNLSYIYILKRLGRNALSNILYDYRGVYQSDADVPVNPATGLRYRIGGYSGEEAYFKAGDPIFTDLNGDYILDQRDLIAAGNSQPRFTGGFGATIQYKNWSFQPSFNFTLKREVINKSVADYFRAYYNPTAGNALLPIDDYDYWSTNNTNATFPNPFDFRRSSIVNGYRYNSTLFEEDGSYFKFQSATVSYNFNRDYIKSKFNITALRLFLTASNIYTFSKYSGPDPELVSALGYDTSDGYPRARAFTFGLDLQF